MNHREPSAITMTTAPVGTASLAELRDHLQRAIELEHATFPPYLCALCSPAPERNPDTVEAVRGVLAERILRIVVRNHGPRITRGPAGGDLLVWPIKEMT
ncbi:ferritin-like domain-containing protein [Spirillospora sp. NPDC048819]|uniref:ferritin-like domain-containing protein n=1 Tax=Spirillospora sp. NPDC048819 TaxID=3155268 RepID=UPI0033DA8164